jgi:hypothetical protein
MQALETEAPAMVRAVQGMHGAQCRLRTRPGTVACCQHRARSPTRGSPTPTPQSRCPELHPEQILLLNSQFPI